MSNTATASVSRSKIVTMAETALLTAIVILMAFTPLGYLRIGITQITFIVVPVAVGAVLLGPKAGAFLRDFMIAQYPDIYGVFAGKGFWAFYGAMFVGVALNIVLEAASCLIIATAICNALWHTVNK